MSLDFVTNEEVIIAARKKLAQGPWDYLVGGSESETTLRRNRLAFDRIAFRPRVLVDVSEIDTSVEFLGQRLRLPILLAPVGSMQTFHPEGAAAPARAAAERGIMQVVSSVTEPGIEKTAEAAPGPKAFQLYIRGDDAWVDEQLARIKAAGYLALCITVDTAVSSRRERPMLTRWGLGTGQPSSRANLGYAAAVTWDTVMRYKEKIGLPLMIKGIATAEDAQIAVDRGVDVIWVSNHGGRQLDHCLGSLDTLPEIAAVAKGKAAIVLDGGVNRGSDVLKALALGADVVAIGRMQAYGLAAAGAEGVAHVLGILEHEIRSAMGLLGVTCLSQLNPSYVTQAEPVTMPHEHSAWVNMPGGRIG